MHELSVCQGLLRQVEQVARQNGAERAVRIVVVIGPLSGVEVPLLERAFDIARMGTCAQDATLEAEIASVRVWCDDCRRESAASINRLVCESCGNWRVSLRSGDELLLKSVELETAAQEAVPEPEPLGS